MKILTLEEWLKKFGDHYKCLRCFTERRSALCKYCRKAYDDYQKAITADKIRLAEFQRMKIQRDPS